MALLARGRVRRLRTTWLLIAAGVLGTSSTAWAEERFALIIGANAGWSNDRPLRHAETDAEHMRDVLVELGGFDPDRVYLLRDPDTSTVRARLRRLDESMRALGNNTLLFVYYSGHADAQYLHLRGSHLSHVELYSLLRESNARIRIGVVDACRSGSILDAKGGRPTAPFETQVVDELAVNGLALLTSSGADELSQEQRALAGSVFTHHLVSGLRGAADADKDGQVTLAEAYQHAFERTQADTAATPVPQRPAFRYELLGQGPVVLSRLVRASSLLVLPRSKSERYVVVDRHEWRLIVEGRSQPEREVLLVVAPGEYRIKRVGQDLLELASIQLAAGERLEVAGLSFTSRPLSSGLLKGRPDSSSPSELRAWQRTEALRLLAAGEARAALRLFDRLLKETPNDMASLRGRGRALIRLAEAYSIVGDTLWEQRALRAALVSDPSLSEDPDFQRWYQRLQEAEAAQQRALVVRAQAESDFQRNPRIGRNWGLGFDFMSTRGYAAVSGLLVLHDQVFPYLAVDLYGGLDGGVRWAPVKRKWSPFVGAGLHVSLGEADAPPGTTIEDSGRDKWREVSAFNVHLDAGMQYVSSSGLSVELGMGTLAYSKKRGGVGIAVWPTLGVQWLF